MHATSYIVTRAGAKKFLEFSDRFAHVIDKELHRYWANGLDIYGLDRPIVVADDGGVSYIDATRNEKRPADRVLLTGANTLQARARRKLEQLCDSVRKRIAFAG